MSSRTRNRRPSHPPARRRRGGFLLTLIKFGFAALLLWMLVGLFYYLWALTFDLSTIGRMPQRSGIYDRNGTFYSRTIGENRVVVPYEQVSLNFVKALISREDSRFYEHRGIDPIGIARAAFRNLLFGGMKEGASTITQQLARNSYDLGGRKDFNRKFLEAAMAFRIEMEMSKEKILELYMNRIYFGSGLYGVEAASQAYFGKPAADMTVSEGALLAGLIRSPNRYSPFNNLEASIRQRDVVLGRMEDLGLITHAEHSKALQEKIAPRLRPLVNPLDSWAVDAILHELEQVVSPSQIDAGGLRIDTTIDAGLQKAAEESVARRLAEVEARPDFQAQHRPQQAPAKGKTRGKRTPQPAVPPAPQEPLQGALIAVDNASGGITAIVGGRSFRESSYNRALVAKRQIGSSAKPFVYEEAFRRGVITPDTPVNDGRLTPAELPPGSPAYDPQNSDGTFGGMLPAREGLVHSRNTMSVRVGLATGLAPVASVMEKLGLAEEVPRYPSICLGSFESTLRNLTVAYTALANGGARVHPHLIEQVADADGKVLFRATHGRVQALDPVAARTTTGILCEVLTRGTAARAASFGFHKPAAGKTGTTDRFADAWFVGYTQGLTCGVWVGFDRPRTIMKGGYGAELALPIWVDVMGSRASDRFAAGQLR